MTVDSPRSRSEGAQAGNTAALVGFLRFLGILDVLALTICFVPARWIAILAETAGVGPFPEAPIAGYLARSASAMYALHALTILYITGDVERYWGLIRFLAWVAIGHGCVLAWVDAAAGMPLWWRVVEGPAFAMTGVIVLWLQRRSRGANAGECHRFNLPEAAPRPQGDGLKKDPASSGGQSLLHDGQHCEPPSTRSA